MSRQKRIRRFQKYVTNPPVKLAVALGIVPTTALLETRGRKTGQPRRTPVGNGYDKGTNTFWIVAEHGRGAAYVKNIEADPRVRVKIGRRWRTGTAHVLADDDPLERQRWMAQEGIGYRTTDRAVRFFGTELLTVRIDLDAG